MPRPLEGGAGQDRWVTRRGVAKEQQQWPGSPLTLLAPGSRLALT